MQTEQGKSCCRPRGGPAGQIFDTQKELQLVRLRPGLGYLDSGDMDRCMPRWTNLLDTPEEVTIVVSTKAIVG